jgi:hypothetical protein
MIRKVYEVNPMSCPASALPPRAGQTNLRSKYRGWMKVVALITEVSVVDRIIDHLKLQFKTKPSTSGIHLNFLPMGK